jgi:single-strand DNA-binding protein
MSGLNRWQGFITLADNAELRFTQGGQAALNFRGACNETYKDREGNKKETTTWVPCVLWGPRGEALAQHLTKGLKVYVEGALRIGTYEKDGEKRTKVEVNVTEIEFAGGRGRSEGAQDAAPAPQRGQQQGRGASGGGYGGGGRGGSRGQSTPPADDFGGDGNPDDDIPFAHSGIAHDLRRYGL